MISCRMQKTEEVRAIVKYKQKWTATKKWKGGNRRRSEFSEGEYSFYMIVTARFYDGGGRRHGAKLFRGDTRKEG